MESYLNENFDLNDPELVSVFDETSLWSAPFGLKALDVIRFKKNANILDVGCGAGFPLLEIAQRFGASSKAYGIDPWTAALDRVKQKLIIMKLRNVQLIEGVAESMPFEDNFFDIITSNNGLNNVQDVKKALAECYRTAKPGCQFVFTANLPDTMMEFYNIYEAVLQRRGLREEIIKMKEHISHKRKTIQEMLSDIRESGFRTNNVFTDVFYYRFADGSSFLSYYFIKLAFLDSWKNIVPKQFLYDIFAEIEKDLNLLAKDNGELKLAVPYACFDCIK
ncbi:MAG TPA: methyltransferase domain-containing protein [Ignavibacteriales bacterium]|nr:methyltransferase domain-containing protein [Ignavibacteriales bacterium]